MAQSLEFGTYVKGESPVHAINAQVKIVLTCAFSIGIFFVDTWLGLVVLALCVSALYGVARIPLSRGLRGIVPILVILAFTVVVHAIPFSIEGLQAGLLQASRIALLVVSCMLLTFTTSAVELTSGLLSLLAPLRRMRVPIDDLALVISLALRFIPATAHEAYAIRTAQMSRCADFDNGNVLARIRAWGSVLVPLLVRLFLRADDLARALDARCYGAGKRTHATGGMMTRGSIAVLVLGLVGLVVLCCFL